VRRLIFLSKGEKIGLNEIGNRILKDDNNFKCDIPTSDEVVNATLNPNFYFGKRLLLFMKDELLSELLLTLVFSSVNDLLDIYYYKNSTVELKAYNFFLKRLFKIVVVLTLSMIIKYILLFYFGERLPDILSNIGIWKCIITSLYRLVIVQLSHPSPLIDSFAPLINNFASYLGYYFSLKILNISWFAFIGSYISNIISNFSISKYKKHLNTEAEHKTLNI